MSDREILVLRQVPGCHNADVQGSVQPCETCVVAIVAVLWMRLLHVANLS